MKVAFIGGGVMGEAILSAILTKRLALSQDTWVCDISQPRCQYLEQKYGVAVTRDKRGAISGGDVVVLAIKPQNLDEVMAELKGQLKPAQLVLSIVAAARVDTLCLGLNHRHVVRVMPNTPAQIGEGMSVWTATAEVTEQQKRWASSILGAMGKEIYVDDEKYIEMATPISGCGPAYFFLFVESLVESAVHIGLPCDLAQKLVFQTVLGSGHFMQQSGKEPSELRRMVATPGGITAEALAQLDKKQFTELVKQAVIAAYDKAKRLVK